MHVLMNEDRFAALDGIHNVELDAGEVYDLPDELARQYIDRGQAEKTSDQPTARPRSTADEGPAPEDENAGGSPEDTSQGGPDEDTNGGGAPEHDPPFDLETAGYGEKLTYYNEHLRPADQKPLFFGTPRKKVDSLIAEALAARGG